LIVFGRGRPDEVALMRQDLTSMIAFLMRLDAKVEQILFCFDIDDGEEEETEN
jgi:hypothetical protein